MATREIDITGKVCPYCLFIVKRKVSEIASGDTLVVKLDHPPATETILFDMKRSGHKATLEKLEPGLWKITIVKK